MLYQARDQDMHGSSVPGSDETLVSTGLKDIERDKKFASNRLYVSTPSVISETKDYVIK